MVDEGAKGPTAAAPSEGAPAPRSIPPLRSVRPEREHRRTTWVTWLAAAAILAVILAVVLVNRARIAAWLGPGSPDSSGSPR
ncbi:MAG TPA: hypothetical protein VIF15_00215 [Polyangiaceae bacterium]